MNPQEIKNAIGIFYPGIALDRCLSRETRKEILNILDWVVIVFIILSLISGASISDKLVIPGNTSVVKFFIAWQDAFFFVIMC